PHDAGSASAMRQMGRVPGSVHPVETGGTGRSEPRFIAYSGSPDNSRRSDFFGFGAFRAPDQPAHATQIGDADQGAIEVVVLGNAGAAGAMIDRHALDLPAGALHQRR